MEILRLILPLLYRPGSPVTNTQNTRSIQRTWIHSYTIIWLAKIKFETRARKWPWKNLGQYPSMDKLREPAIVFSQLVRAPAEIRTQHFQKYNSGIFLSKRGVNILAC
jgi:hypothetical protein